MFQSPAGQRDLNLHCIGLSGVGLLVIRTHNGGRTRVGVEEPCSPYHKVDGSVS